LGVTAGGRSLRAARLYGQAIIASALDERLERITNQSFQEPYRVLLVDDDKMLADYYK